MQNDNEIKRINNFLSTAGPLILEFVDAILCSLGLEVKREGTGLETAFVVKHNEGDIKFYVHNLLLEIATIDRDEEPLRFDERLRDFDFFMSKTKQIVQSKLNILMKVFSTDDIEAAIEKIKTESEHYERINIWMLDPKKFN
jgi:hypothetical protein